MLGYQVSDTKTDYLPQIFNNNQIIMITDKNGNPLYNLDISGYKPEDKGIRI